MSALQFASLSQLHHCVDNFRVLVNDTYAGLACCSIVLQMLCINNVHTITSLAFAGGSTAYQRSLSAHTRVVGIESWTWTQVGLESDFLRTWTGLGLEGQGLGLGLGLEG